MHDNVTKALVFEYLMKLHGFRGIAGTFNEKCKEMHGASVDLDLLDTSNCVDLTSVIRKELQVTPRKIVPNPSHERSTSSAHSSQPTMIQQRLHITPQGNVRLCEPTIKKKRIARNSVVSDSRFSVLRDALTAYKAKHGHVDVPYLYVVDRRDTLFPEHTWGVRLGRRLICARRSKCQKHREALTELGVDLIDITLLESF